MPTHAPLRAFFIAMALALPALPGSAQEQVVCDIGGCKEVSIAAPRFSEASAFNVQQVWVVVNEILAVSGLLPNFQVVETEEVGNAAAIIIEGERYLAFNPTWMAQYKSDPNARWQLYGVLAHEIGHHLQGHTITGQGSRPPTELEADEYAGFILAALGADLGQAQSLWATLSEQGSTTHPPRHQRLSAVERGWMRRTGQAPSTSRPVVQTAPQPTLPQPGNDAPPPPSWAMDNCASTYMAGRSAQLCASSILASQGANNYRITNLLDGNASTAWVEGVPGHGIGQGFVVVFDTPTPINSLRLLNGYTKSERSFTRNSRVRTLLAKSSNGKEVELSLADSTRWQSLSPLDSLGPAKWISFEILDVYPGSKYADTCISEFELR